MHEFKSKCNLLYMYAVGKKKTKKFRLAGPLNSNLCDTDVAL